MGNSLENILIQRCQNGDCDAFAPLLNIYREQLFTYLVRRCGDTELAEDMFQETTIKMWKNIKKYREKKKFGSWLFSIAHNISVDEYRKIKSRSRFNNKMKNVELSDNSIVISSIEAKEQALLVRKSLSKLSDHQRDVFLLRQQ